jgi:hypothetical protein
LSEFHDFYLTAIEVETTSTIVIARRYNPSMEGECAEILARAIRLPKEARAALADSLLETLDTEVDENAEEAWRLEIRRRLAEIDSDAVDLIHWTDARKRLESRLKGDRQASLDPPCGPC